MKDTLKDQWSHLKSKIQAEWSDFTEDDLNDINGNESKLLKKLQETYDYSKEEAQAAWEKFSQDALEVMDDTRDNAHSILTGAKKDIHSYVTNSPWKALGAAALIGLFIGLRF